MLKIKDYVKIVQDLAEKDDFLEAIDVLTTDFNYYLFDITKDIKDRVEQEQAMYKKMKYLNKKFNFIFKYAHEQKGTPEIKSNTYINRNVQVSMQTPTLRGFYNFLNKYFSKEIDELTIELTTFTAEA